MSSQRDNLSESEGSSDGENYEPTPKVKKTRPLGRKNNKPMQSLEVAVIFEWIKNKYEDLVGCGKTFQYSENRKKTWDALAQAVNEVFDGKYNRSAQFIAKWIENLRFHS